VRTLTNYRLKRQHRTLLVPARGKSPRYKDFSIRITNRQYAYREN
jgi:hypothetical protein